MTKIIYQLAILTMGLIYLGSAMAGQPPQISTLSPERSMEITRNILNRTDPEGIYSKTNVDEYDAEAILIAAFAFTFRSNIENHSDTLKKQINRVWNLYFDHDCKTTNEVASKIIAQVTKMRTPKANSGPEKTDPAFAQALERLDAARLNFFSIK